MSVKPVLKPIPDIFPTAVATRIPFGLIKASIPKGRDSLPSF
jgi:hypothetical protein